MKKKPRIKTYSVNIDMVWSQEYSVKARTAAEARQKAFERFKKRTKKKDFNINTYNEG